MSTTRSHQILHLLLLFFLTISCTPQAIQDIVATSSQPSTLPPTDSPSTLAPASPTPKPTRAPQRTTRTTGTPAYNQGSSATQNLLLEVPTHPIDVILGRPTNHSITLSVLAYQDFEGYIEYGVSPDVSSSQTPLGAFHSDQPVEVLIDSLQANTAYTYRVRYRTENVSEFAATETNTFYTQRATDSPFTFTIQADSHLDSNSSPQVYVQTLTNECTAQPDFQIDLGDTFMTDKYQPYTGAQPQYLAQRYYLSLIGQSAPLFLVLGNHDGEGALRGGAANAMSSWSAKLRTEYFPNPEPDDFYTGNSTPENSVGLLQDYYAWEWGDALLIVLDPYWFTQPQQGTTNLWNPTLGATQYQWLKTTLETSPAQWKFVFIHQLVGGLDKNGRGGIEIARYFEWGGNNADGSWGFDLERPGWAMPVHQLFVTNHVTAVFHGHDHLFVKQELDGIIYQEVPQPSAARSGSTDSAAAYGYVNGDVLGSSGHLRVSVMPEQVIVEYVRTFLPQDETSNQLNGQVDYRYTISP